MALICDQGYITLKQASDISGRTTEALKKQCQEGRIRGAIKQGKTWFVPQSEIVWELSSKEIPTFYDHFDLIKDNFYCNENDGCIANVLILQLS